MYVPLHVELLCVSGIEQSMRAMRLPKNGKSDSTSLCVGLDDARIAKRLIKAGPDHAKAMRGVVAWIKIDMQTGWMIEFETYRHGVECLSTSSSMHSELVGIHGVELAEKKQADLLDKVYVRIVTISYQALRSMYKARRHHRHPDWRIFCNFIEKMPYFEKLIFPEYDEAEL